MEKGGEKVRQIVWKNEVPLSGYFEDLLDDFDSLEETESRNEASASQCQRGERGERGAFRRATRLSLLPFYPCSCI